MSISKDMLEILKSDQIFNKYTNYYDSIKDYFFNVLTTQKYQNKIIMDDETFKLLKIFKEIFENFPSELPNNKPFQVYGQFFIKDEISSINPNSKILLVNEILDDISIKENIILINNLIRVYNIDSNNFGIWTNIGVLDDKENWQCKYLKHFELKTINDKYAFARAISRFTTCYDIFKSKDTDYNNFDNINSKFKRIYINENELLRRLKIVSKIVFIDITSNKFPQNQKIYSGIKIYQFNKTTKIIPFLIMPTIKKNDIYNYFHDIFTELGSVTIPCELQIPGQEKNLYNYCIEMLKWKLVKKFEKICNDSNINCNCVIEKQNLDLNIINLISNSISDDYSDFSNVIKKSIYEEELIATLIKLNDSNKIKFNTIIDEEAKTIVKKSNEYIFIAEEYMPQEALMIYKTFLKHYIINYEFYWDLAIFLDKKYKTGKFKEYLNLKEITSNVKNEDEEFNKIISLVNDIKPIFDPQHYAINRNIEKYFENNNSKYYALDCNIERYFENNKRKILKMLKHNKGEL